MIYLASAVVVVDSILVVKDKVVASPGSNSLIPIKSSSRYSDVLHILYKCTSKRFHMIIATNSELLLLHFPLVVLGNQVERRRLFSPGRVAVVRTA